MRKTMVNLTAAAIMATGLGAAGAVPASAAPAAPAVAPPAASAVVSAASLSHNQWRQGQERFNRTPRCLQVRELRRGVRLHNHCRRGLLVEVRWGRGKSSGCFWIRSGEREFVREYGRGGFHRYPRVSLCQRGGWNR